MELESNTIEELKKEIALLKRKLEPDELAKQIDKSYFSVNNLRCFLQILSIIMTIFVGVAAGFGFFGVKNILSIGETESAMRDRYGNFQSKEKLLTEKVDTIEKNLKDISSIFNNVSIAKNKVLSAREQQLLMFLAKEIDPKSPLFKYNMAVCATNFGRYDEALQYLSEIDLNSVPANTLNIEWAKDLKRICENFKKNPPKEPRLGDPPKGATVDVYTYANAQLFGNIVGSLLTNGYLNPQQAESIFGKAQERAKEAYGDALIKTW
ncbi:MAG: hypothetical protein U0586_08645 [Candidatus Brocadiaceae bacterium]